MKQLTTKMKILICILAIIIIAGIAIIFTKGFNVELKYQQADKVQLYINKEFEISDIKQITDEVLGTKEVLIQKVEVYEDSVSIIAKEITEEQKSNLINKVNEKYETELVADTTSIETIPHARLRDLVKPYIVPFIIATVLVVLYLMVMYKKLGMLKIALKSILTLSVVILVIFSIVAICRIPMGRLTMPILLVGYVLTIYGMTNCFDKKQNDNGDGDKCHDD